MRGGIVSQPRESIRASGMPPSSTVTQVRRCSRIRLADADVCSRPYVKWIQVRAFLSSRALSHRGAPTSGVVSELAGERVESLGRVSRCGALVARLAARERSAQSAHPQRSASGCTVLMKGS